MSEIGSAPPLALSAKGLQRIASISHENDFVFVVGDNRYRCPCIIAEFLSPRISSLRSQDASIQEFYVETADPHHSFATFLSLGCGHKIVLRKDNSDFVRSVSHELWNFELFGKALENGKGHTEANDLLVALHVASGLSENCDAQVTGVASHFHEFSASDFDDLSFSVLEAIVNNGSLLLESEDLLFEVIHRQASRDSRYFSLLECVRFEYLSDSCMKTAFEFICDSFELVMLGIWTSLGGRLKLSVNPPRNDRCLAPPVPDLDSKIVATFPDICPVFENKKFELLYRGSRDGFGGADFHRCSDEHSNTLTLIQSDKGSIFGGFTPLTWWSGVAPDLNLGSFLFTIKNPHNLPPRIFRQCRAESPIQCHFAFGPTFGAGADLYVHDHCNANSTSYSQLGYTYTNDTGIADNAVLTGAYNFWVKEIEVFEVIEST
jgi:hypothetical protein